RPSGALRFYPSNGASMPNVDPGRRFAAHPYTWTRIIKELNSSSFKSLLHEGKRGCTRPDLAVEGFHAPDGADRDSRFACEIGLLPTHERTRGFELSARDHR